MNFNPWGSLKNFISESRRVLGVSYKPSNEVFKRTLKIVLIGVLLLGFLGFIISLIISFVG